ncbi:hypothetical protein PF005_g12800 [Phytophthora fragariae]|uniref:Uncharacterized protein n=1 Tax=Phytophthora fragariae TaxID=53985 RepID=A0A6A3XR64_9STRA|nr:hypothetical protein PF003_g2045 [Phytophthora fragariae]KAE8936065.1 hypothetical protein PF009_g14005 [Phytophthora fragariae]KAE9008345.1 hypothetical protein PF011_g10747 [Phytophthora fragariae]KAE9084780.1 hypothetical protein PF010_g20700 [Phytophthora fragariae]KAE9109653.1 hypothetical protein PF007_g12171 [Phytophthora fragariae]
MARSLSALAPLGCSLQVWPTGKLVVDICHARRCSIVTRRGSSTRLIRTPYIVGEPGTVQ